MRFCVLSSGPLPLSGHSLHQSRRTSLRQWEGWVFHGQVSRVAWKSDESLEAERHKIDSGFCQMAVTMLLFLMVLLQNEANRCLGRRITVRIQWDSVLLK